MNQRDNESWHLLYIDDDEEDYIITRQMLSQSQQRLIHFDWASTYEEGRSKLSADHAGKWNQHGRYNAVLVDYDLGMKTGVELIREFSRDYAAPLILFTGRGSREVDLEAMQVGATMYLSKREANSLLLERIIRYAIEIKHKERSLEETRDRLQQELIQRKRVEEQIAQMAESLEIDRSRLSAVLESLPVGVWISDQNGRVVQKNAQADKIWAGDAPHSENIDHEREDMAWYSASSASLLPDEHPMAAILRTGESAAPVEVNIRRFDGSVGTILVSAAAIRDGSGQLAGTVGVNVDITTRKLQEQALQIAYDNATRFSRFPDENPNPVGRASHEGRVLFRNVVAAKTPGWECEVGELVPAPVQALVQNALAVGVMVQEDIQLADRNYSVTVVPFLSDNYVNFYGMDITERQYIEKALETSQQKLVDVLESMNDGFFALDQSWHYSYINKHALQISKLTLDETIGKDIWQLFPGLIGTELEGYYHQVMEQRVPAKFTTRGMLSGKIYDVQVNPTQEGISVFYTDKTEQIQAEEARKLYARELERSNQALQEFASIASHDLQEPLREITSFGRLLEVSFGDQIDADGRDYLQRMLAAAGRMGNMIEALLAYSRVTSRAKMFVAVHLSNVAQEVISDMEGRILETGGQVIVDDPLPIIDADPVQMQHLFQNLIANGLKYHREGVAPVVRVSAQVVSEQMVEISIQDNGIGFAMQDSEYIFEPFVRLHGKANFEGTGIGLAICKKIVERHGGVITVASAVNHGTTFTAKLPIRQET